MRARLALVRDQRQIETATATDAATREDPERQTDPTPPAPVRQPVTEVSSLHIAVLSDRDGLQPDPAMFYEESYQACLAAIVTEAIAALAPVRDDRLVQHVARLHRFSRVGREIKERVLALLPEANARTTEGGLTFIWPSDTVPASWHRFRPPAPGIALDPSDLPLEELTALAPILFI